MALHVGRINGKSLYDTTYDKLWGHAAGIRIRAQKFRCRRLILPSRCKGLPTLFVSTYLRARRLTSFLSTTSTLGPKSRRNIHAVLTIYLDLFYSGIRSLQMLRRRQTSQTEPRCLCEAVVPFTYLVSSSLGTAMTT